MLSREMSRSRTRLWLWHVPALLVAAVVLVPLAFLLSAWTHIDSSIWSHLAQTQLLALITNTLVLALGVGVVVSVVGVSLAWLTALCDFPGRRIFDWALIVPLAIPPYVLAFVVLGFFDFGGGFSQLRLSLGVTSVPPDVRTLPMLVLVMSAVLYPYVYLLTRSILLRQGREAMDAARLLGASPIQAIWRVGLPMARPGIVAGVSLAIMETLADFGAVSVFNFNTFTTAIYKSWIALFSLNTAAQLASLLLLFVLLALGFEQWSRRAGRVDQKQAQRAQRYSLNGFAGVLASMWCGTVLAFSLILPLIQLLIWGIGSEWSAWQGLWQLAQNTFVLAGITALVVVVFALMLSWLARVSPQFVWYPRCVSWGYAVPGSVLAVAMVFAAAAFDNGWLWLGDALGFHASPLLVGSIVGLVVAYAIRFFRPAVGPIQSGLRQLRPALVDSAQLLGASPIRILCRVVFPLMVPGLLTAALLVFVDVSKEMPATLLMRPFGWDTLATRVYQFTSEGEWQRAAIPSLWLVAVSFFPVVLLIHRSRR